MAVSAGLVEARALTVRIGRHELLSEVDLTVGRGEIVSLIGPNGAGKTTLLRAILGVLKPTAGMIWRGQGLVIGYVPQRLQLDPVLPLTVERFLTIGLAASASALNGALAEVRATHLRRAPMHELSGGEFQRALLARALLRRPDLLSSTSPARGWISPARSSCTGWSSRSATSAAAAYSWSATTCTSSWPRPIASSVSIATSAARGSQKPSAVIPNTWRCSGRGRPPASRCIRTSTITPTVSPARSCRRTRPPQGLPKRRHMPRMRAILDDFIVRAILGGVGVAALAGPLGCFVVWRRMAFFGHALAHSALLGISLGALLAIDLNLATVTVCLAFAIALVLLQRQPALSTDTILGILAHIALALGLVVLSFLEWLRVDLMAYLFGDVFAVTASDLIWIWGGGALALAALLWLWSALLSITLNEELAQAEGVDVGRVQFGFVLVMALAVAIGMKIVGILLIVSLLVIPAAAARHLARTPEQMAGFAALIGALAVVMGIGGSFRWDTPAGPTIVLATALLFVLAMALGPALRPARPE